jgi:dsRNA-specific ribonuclease
MTRINLRLPEQLKAGVEQAAGRERLSVNAWLVRAVAAAVAGDGGERRVQPRGGRTGQSFKGWVQ